MGEYDNSVVLDSHYLRPWAVPLMKQLVQRDRNQWLWNFEYGHYCNVFRQVSGRLQLGHDQMMHSGPSIDRARDVQPLREVQKRGRWKSHKNVTRYEKSARLAANFQSLPGPLQQHCLLAERQLERLEAVMLGKVRPPWPPLLPKG